MSLRNLSYIDSSNYFHRNDASDGRANLLINDQILIARIQSKIMDSAKATLDDRIHSLEDELNASKIKPLNESTVPLLPLEVVTRIVSFVPRVARIGGKIEEFVSGRSNRNGQVTNWLPHIVDRSRRPIVELHNDTYPALLKCILSRKYIDFRVHLSGFWELEKLDLLLEEPTRWVDFVIDCNTMLETKAVLTRCGSVLSHIRSLSAQVWEPIQVDSTLTSVLDDVRRADGIKLEDATIPSPFLYAFISVGLLRSVTTLELVISDKDDWKNNLMSSIPKLSQLAHLQNLCITDRTKESFGGCRDLHARSDSLKTLQLRIESSKTSLGVPAYLDLFRSCAIKSLEIPPDLSSKSRKLVLASLTRHFPWLLEIRFVGNPPKGIYGKCFRTACYDSYKFDHEDLTWFYRALSAFGAENSQRILGSIQSLNVPYPRYEETRRSSLKMLRTRFCFPNAQLNICFNNLNQEIGLISRDKLFEYVLMRSVPFVIFAMCVREAHFFRTQTLNS